MDFSTFWKMQDDLPNCRYMKSIYLIVASLMLGLFTGCDISSSGDEDQTTQDAMIQSDSVVLALPKAPPVSASDVLTALPDLENRLTWEDLQDVNFEEKYYEDIDQFMLFPVFGDKIKAMENKTWVLSGYVIPVTPGDQDNPPLYVLSANPFSACFFCGNAGPESVVELELQEPYVLYGTDEFRSFEGSLQLNDSNVDRLNYILVDAELK